MAQTRPFSVTLGQLWLQHASAPRTPPSLFKLMFPRHLPFSTPKARWPQQRSASPDLARLNPAQALLPSIDAQLCWVMVGGSLPPHPNQTRRTSTKAINPCFPPVVDG